MADDREQALGDLNIDPQPTAVGQPATGVVPESATSDHNGVAAAPAQGAASHWHAEAGRKGARRLRELIHEGKLYEQEHGLTRGRQRIRQLIQEGKLYEQEHGLRPKKAGTRGPRMSSEQLLANLFEAVLRLAKPKYRAQIVHLIQELERR